MNASKNVYVLQPGPLILIATVVGIVDARVGMVMLRPRFDFDVHVDFIEHVVVAVAAAVVVVAVVVVVGVVGVAGVVVALDVEVASDAIS